MRRGLTLKFNNKNQVVEFLGKIEVGYVYKVQPIIIIQEFSGDIIKSSFESILIVDDMYHIEYFNSVIEDFIIRYDTNNYMIVGYELYITILSDNPSSKEKYKKMILEKYVYEVYSNKSILLSIRKFIRKWVTKIYRWIMRNI